MAQIFTKTATKARKGKGKVYALGRQDTSLSKPKASGGYILFVLCENYAGHVRGGIAKTWRAEKDKMSYEDAIDLMNRRVGFKAFEL